MGLGCRAGMVRLMQVDKIIAEPHGNPAKTHAQNISERPERLTVKKEVEN